MGSYYIWITNIFLFTMLPYCIARTEKLPAEFLNRLKRQLEYLNQYGNSDNLLNYRSNNFPQYKSLSTNLNSQQQQQLQQQPQQLENFYNYQIPQNFFNTQTSSQLQRDSNIEHLFQSPSFLSSKIESSNEIDSPIYYVKLPPTPYNFLPGFGYISQSPLKSLPFQLPLTTPHANYQQMFEPLKNSLINLPLEFISNGKPTNILHLNNEEEIYNPQEQQHFQHYQPQLQYLKGLNLPLSAFQTTYNSLSMPSQTEMYNMNLWPRQSPKKNSQLKRLKNTLTFNGKPEHIRIHSDGDMLENYEAML